MFTVVSSQENCKELIHQYWLVESEWTSSWILVPLWRFWFRTMFLYWQRRVLFRAWNPSSWWGQGPGVAWWSTGPPSSYCHSRWWSSTYGTTLVARFWLNWKQSKKITLEPRDKVEIFFFVSTHHCLMKAWQQSREWPLFSSARKMPPRNSLKPRPIAEELNRVVRIAVSEKVECSKGSNRRPDSNRGSDPSSHAQGKCHSPVG